LALTIGLNRAAIERLLRELGDELAATDAPPCRLIAVGGSYLAFFGLRGSTRDFDTISVVDAALLTAVRSVADRNDLRPDWLNAQARPFAPLGLGESDCTVLFTHQQLTVLGPPPAFVFLMKLEAARPTIDIDDMVGLWPLCDFESPYDAVARYRAAYPNALEDEFLVEFVEQIAKRSVQPRPEA
jgi:hypothetical protein